MKHEAGFPAFTTTLRCSCAPYYLELPFEWTASMTCDGFPRSDGYLQHEWVAAQYDANQNAMPVEPHEP